MRSLKYFCACALLILAACSKDKADISKTMLALNLQSGGSVSSDTADDLYPQLVQPGNGTITLFFVSNRNTASGCSASAYCIFVSQSVTGYSDGNAALPKFTDPVALNVAGTAVTSTSAQGIAAFYDGSVPGYKVVYSDNTNAVKLATLPTANLSSGTLQAAAATESGPSGARSGVVNGAINLGGMFYVLGDGGATQKKIQTATAGDAGTLACAITDNCRWITYIRSAGANSLDFLHISTDGLLYRSSGGSSRAADSFNKTLAKGGLRLSGLSSLGHGNSDLLLVSANTGGQNDLYVLNTPIKTAVTVVGAPPPVGAAGTVTATATSGIPETTATRVYGQNGSFATTGTGITSTTMNGPHTAIAVDAGGVYIGEFTNNRVMYYAGTSTTATRVYGQNSFTCNVAKNNGSCVAGAISATNLDTPFGVAVDATGVYISDSANNRILFYPGTSTTATRVYGQAGSFTTGTANNPTRNADSLSNPRALYADGTGLYAVDAGNNRILYYPGTSTTASRVYGQFGDFTCGVANNNGSCVAGTPSANSINVPYGIFADASGVYTTEATGMRALFFPGTSTTATRVYGQGGSFTTATQSTTATGLANPYAIVANANGVFIADETNKRVLFYPGTSTTATIVYGQPAGNFTCAALYHNGTCTGGTAAANNMNSATGLAIDSTGLYIQDYGANRVLFFPRDTTAPVISAVAPANSATPSDAKVSYTLSETCASGSITWTRTGGTADGASPHVKALTGTELTQGTKTNITLANNPTLVVGAIYSVGFNCTDAAGLAATTVTSTNVTMSQSGWFTFAGDATGSQAMKVFKATSDGGVLAVGWSTTNYSVHGGQAALSAYTGTSGTTYDVWIIKYSSTGAVEWHTYGARDAVPGFFFAGQLSDGTYIVMASITGANNATVGGVAPLVQNPSTGEAHWVARYNTNGSVSWHSFRGTAAANNFFHNGAVGSDDSIYSVGYVNAATAFASPVTAYTGGNEAWMNKWNTSGSVVWHTYAGSAGADTAYGVGVAGDGSVYWTGEAAATFGAPLNAFNTGNDIWVQKLNSSGAPQWLTFAGGTGSETFPRIAVASDGSVYAVGTVPTAFAVTGTAFSGTGSNLYTVKYSAAGAKQWDTFAGTTTAAGLSTQHSSIAAGPDGNVVISSMTTATLPAINGQSLLNAFSGGTSDAYLLKYNPTGTVVWHTCAGAAGVATQMAGLGIASDNSIFAGWRANGNVATLSGKSPVNAHSGGAQQDAMVIKFLSGGGL